MAFDFDYNDPTPPQFSGSVFPSDPRDLEVIVCLLEMSAISLTKKAGATFTFEELFGEARRYGGSELLLREQDVRIVVDRSKYLFRKTHGRLALR